MLREISVKNIPVWGNEIQSKGNKNVENPWCSSSRLQGEETVRDWNIDGHRLKPRLTSLELPFLSISFQILMNYYWRKYKYHLSKRLVTSETLFTISTLDTEFVKIKSATVQHSQIVILVMLLRLNVLSECIDVITVLIPRDIKIKEGARKSWPLNTHKYLLVSICFRNKEQMTEAFWVLW